MGRLEAVSGGDMSKHWEAVIVDMPDEESHKEYPTDPQDWKFELQRVDAAGDIIHEIIHVVFTGTIGDEDEVIATPEDEVYLRIEAMLKGLNS